MTHQQELESGAYYHQSGRFAEAAKIYRRILAQQPDHPEATHNLGVLEYQLGRNDVALHLIRRAIAVKPNYPEAYSSLGNALRALGDLDEAIEAFHQAVLLRPDLAEGYCNLGNVQADCGHLDDAIVSYRQAIQLKRGLVHVHTNLGIALEEKGLFDEALAAYRQAIQIDPRFASAHANLGNTLREMSLIDESLTSYGEAIRLKPDFDMAHRGFLFTLNFHPGYDAEAIYEQHRLWNQWRIRRFGKTIAPLDNDRTPDRKLRIGYVSGDFCNHVAARNIIPLFIHRDRAHFETFCYSNVSKPDVLTQGFQHQSDAWREIRCQSDEVAAELIRRDRIDILVDLGLHTCGNRLGVFIHKPAPVQFTFAGYPGTTGLTTIDYRLTDPYLDPPGYPTPYSEESVRLPHSFWCYDFDAMEIGSASEIAPLPALANGYITFGCLNNPCKLNPFIIQIWSRVLAALPDARMIVLARMGKARELLLDVFNSAGTSPDRLEFVDRQKHSHYLDTFNRIDICLDTLPYNGHTTSLDSFCMGVPLVTQVGGTVVGRAGFSQLSNLGLAHLAARDEGEFVRIAVNLAADLPALSELRRTLRERMRQSPLCDSMGFARSIEAAYRKAWHTWCGTLGL